MNTIGYMFENDLQYCFSTPFDQPYNSFIIIQHQILLGTQY